ncbi:MAG TPA: hypothetical protein VET69_10530, partial [Terriglobales bacterium]|nr:hypothetical protein [Terriglobales bacterium]
MKNSRRALTKTALQKEKVEGEAPRLQKGSTGEERELGRESSSQARIELAAIVESSDDAILSKN